MTATVLIYVTAPNRDEAVRIGREIVTDRLAACANVLPGMTSIYQWQGEIREDSEAVLILKTRRDLADRLVVRVRELHPYETPAILVLPVQSGNPAFLEWIQDETRVT
jgi:periplasmic divalent cation tolerance protein